MRLRGLIFPVISCLLGGCAQLGYYGQLARGQYELMSRREPIATIVADGQRDAALRRRLALVQDARRYAATALALPDNRSYTLYTELDRDYVVWNVFATPELSLKPVESCFPIAGCLAYRGYYREAAAQQQAAALKALGYDVHVGGVSAYSTLGWFADPVISTMLHWSDAQLVDTLFHELAHQRLFVKDDTAFNESFASFVGEEGLRQYVSRHSPLAGDEPQRQQRQAQFVKLVLATRERLQALYESAAVETDKRSGKQAEFERLRREYAELREHAWSGYRGYDEWFEQDLNNARLLPFGLYDEWVPAFAALYRESGSDWPVFYAAAAALGKLAVGARTERLQSLRRRLLPE